MSWFTRGYQRGVAASAGNHWGYSVGAGTLGGLAIGGGVSYATDSHWGLGIGAATGASLGAFGKSFANHTVTGNWGIGGKHIRKGLPSPKVPLLEYKPGPKIPWL